MVLYRNGGFSHQKKGGDVPIQPGEFPLFFGKRLPEGVFVEPSTVSIKRIASKYFLNSVNQVVMMGMLQGLHKAKVGNQPRVFFFGWHILSRCKFSRSLYHSYAFSVGL